MIATLILAATLAWTPEWSGFDAADAFPGKYWAISDSVQDTDKDARLWLGVIEDGEFVPEQSHFVPTENYDWEDLAVGGGHVYILDSFQDSEGCKSIIELVEPKKFGDAAVLIKRHMFEMFNMRANACFYCPDIPCDLPVGIICATDNVWMIEYNSTVWGVLGGEAVKIGSVLSILPVGGADWHNGKLLLSQYTGYQQVAFEPEDPVFGCGPSRGHVEAICFGFDGSVIEVSESGRVFK